MSGSPTEGERHPREARGWFWLQLLIGWLPVWALYVTMITTAHGTPVTPALFVAARAIISAALLGLLVLRLTERQPWPRPLRASFVLVHAVAAVVYAVTWVALTSLIEGALHGQHIDGLAERALQGHFIVIAPSGIVPFLILGIWLYIAVAGVSYAAGATERAARAEAAAAKSRLAALRSQLNPHFLFNALHTVVQLIPVEPARAAQAAERLAGLLRTTIQEDRDLVTLDEEREFVERYLELERIRFGDRLLITFDMSDDVSEALVPSLVLQTLVENAVQHGAAPRVEPTRITISAGAESDQLVLTVADTGAGADPARVEASVGTGLRRLRERLKALYGTSATLRIVTSEGGGFSVTVSLPLQAE